MMPRTIVPTTPIGSGPGTTARAMKPAMRPMTMRYSTKPSMNSFPLGLWASSFLPPSEHRQPLRSLSERRRSGDGERLQQLAHAGEHVVGHAEVAGGGVVVDVLHLRGADDDA